MNAQDAARDVVTWQNAEDALIGALEYLAALPDRERGFLSAGSRSGWPQVIREKWEYPDGGDPRVRVGRKEMALLDRVLLGERAAVLAVPLACGTCPACKSADRDSAICKQSPRGLLGRVLVMKRWQSPGGFRWEEVWMREGGRACGVTSDALRMRYERAVGKVAVAMERAA